MNDRFDPGPPADAGSNDAGAGAGPDRPDVGPASGDLARGDAAAGAGADRTDDIDDPSLPGPLTRAAALALLDRAAALLEAGEPRQAAGAYQRLIGHRDAAITAAALLGLGQALRRLDREDEAQSAWQSVLQLPATPSAYPALREIAAARVRSGDLPGAIDAYRQADRRAPAQDKAEIASRLGWLLKETGDTRAAGRQFARARAAGPALPWTWIVVAVTVVVSVAAWAVYVSGANPGPVYAALELNKHLVADGQLWRLLTVTLVHYPLTFGILHLFFNMYALWLVGPLVEELYGSPLFLGFYVLCAFGGSIASYVANDAPAVGASGAIFGLFGVLLAASRVHSPVIDRRSRALLSQLGPIIVINLALNVVETGIDIWAHIGGLASGLWLGYLLVPGRVPTLGRLWRQPVGEPTHEAPVQAVLRMLGVVALVLVFVVGLVIGNAQRQTPRRSAAASAVTVPAESPRRAGLVRGTTPNVNGMYARAASGEPASAQRRL